MRKAHRSVPAIAAAVLVAVAALPGGASAAPPDPAQQLSAHPIAEDPAWQSYDEAPTTSIVRPAHVLDVVGAVTDPDALASTGGGTTLTYTLGGTIPSLILDYGQDVGGEATFGVSATTGAVIKSVYSETLANMGNDDATSVVLFQSGTVARSQTFDPTRPGVVTSHVIEGAQRYEKVTLQTPGRVTLGSAGIVFSAMRETPSTMAGHFLSSDDQLNRIWYAGAYTLNLNQLQPGTPVADGGVNQLHLILDGAKRDRAVWSGDHMISDLTDYYVSDPAYARDSLSLFLDHPATVAAEAVPAVGLMALPGPLPGACSPNPALADICVTWSASYSLAVVPAVWNYYLYTGDTTFIRQHWAAVTREMAWDAQQVDARGLFDVNAGDGEDWNVESTSGELTYVNALYVEALRSAASLATALGLPAQAASWNSTATAVTRTVNADLWNAATGVYDASTAQRGSVVQDANVTAVLAGIASPAQAASIATVLPQALATPYGPATVSADPAPSGYKRVISPYMGGFNVLSDFASGDEAAALALIRQEWGFMIGNDPGGVTWERIELDGIPAGGLLADSSAHAWSTGPTPALSEYVVGVTPSAPGYSRWSVAPQPGNLQWAQGAVPTPHGTISVRWQTTAGRSFAITVQAPAGTTGTVAIPLDGADRTIARDGIVVYSGGQPAAGVTAHQVGDSVVFSQSAGTDTYAWSQ